MNEHLKLIMVSIVLILSILLFFSIRSCTSNRNERDMLKESIEAIYDTIHYYKGKNDELVASKKLLQGDLDILKTVNKELYDKIESMKQKGVDHVVYVESVIENPPDTIYWEIDNSEDSITKHFNFNDRWRVLEGYVSYTPNQLGLNITKDQVYFDYTLAIRDNQVYITSENPYIRYNEITGLVIPQQLQKKKHWSVGPMIYGGFDVMNRKFGAGIGIGVTYSLFSF